MGHLMKSSNQLLSPEQKLSEAVDCPTESTVALVGQRMRTNDVQGRPIFYRTNYAHSPTLDRQLYEVNKAFQLQSEGDGWNKMPLPYGSVDQTVQFPQQSMEQCQTHIYYYYYYYYYYYLNKLFNKCFCYYTSGCKSAPAQYTNFLLFGASTKLFKKQIKTKLMLCKPLFIIVRVKDLFKVTLEYKTKCLSCKSGRGTCIMRLHKC